MIQHIFKILWKDRKSNFWIFLELVIIFSILWFCSDYLSFMVGRYIKPIGFDVENVYRLSFSVNENKLEEMKKETGEDVDVYKIVSDIGWTVFDRIKQHPSVETASASVMLYPYFGGNMSRGFFVNKDTMQVTSKVEYGLVSPEYFDVFKIPITRGRNFIEGEQSVKQLMIDTNDKGLFSKFAVDTIQSLTFDLGNKVGESYKMLGVVGSVKRDPFHHYQNHVYQMMNRNDIVGILNTGNTTAMFMRVKADRDGEGFADKFVNEMYDQLSIAPLYLSAVTPMSEVKDAYMAWRSYDSDFKSIGAIAAFLLVNIFLGLIGTFWFRTRDRRGEIGLRMSVGSSQSRVERIFVGETLLLVLVASIIGFIISVNIGFADILKDVGVPVPYRNGEEVDALQYVLNFGLTFCTIALVSVLAVWYPARQAAKTQPAIALREE